MKDVPSPWTYIPENSRTSQHNNFVVIAFVFFIAITGAGADAGLGVGVGPGIGAVDFAIAVTVTVTGAIAVTGTVAVAGAVAFIAAGTFAIIGAFAISGAFAGALAFAIAIVLALALDRYLIRRKTAMVRLLRPVALIVALLFCILPPLLTQKFTSVNIEVWGIEGKPFIFIFFVCGLPLLNALSDWFSVSFTQFCLHRYEANPKKWWFWIIADLLFAFVLLVTLFVCIFALLEFMSFCGWKVNPELMLISFSQNPFSQQNIWITLLVCTNLAPTILHLTLLALAFFNGWFNPISYRVRELLKTVDLVKGKTSKELEEIPLDERTWHTEDAKAVAFYLAGMPIVNALLIFSLVWPFVYGAYIGVTEILVWGIEGLLS